MDLLLAFVLGLMLVLCGWGAAGEYTVQKPCPARFSTDCCVYPNVALLRLPRSEPIQIIPRYCRASLGQHTLGHADCPACEAAKRNVLMQADFAGCAFEIAAALWLDSHKHYIRAATTKDYECCIVALTRFLRGTKLCDISIGTIREYQLWRSEKAGASRINHETCCLTQILRYANLWGPIAPHFRPLPLPKPRIGKAISPEEEDRLFEKAAKGRKRWHVAYWCSSLMANTAAGPGEIRNLRLGDVDLIGRTIHIREGTKNDYRIRRIPLNQTAFKQACRLVDRYRDLCAKEHHQECADDCLLPHRAHKLGQPLDFSKPMGSWRKAWEKIRASAGLQHVRQYDLRHHAITKLLENPDVSEETVKSIAGHVSKRILQTYSHIRVEARREAVDALDRKKPERIELVTDKGA